MALPWQNRWEISLLEKVSRAVSYWMHLQNGIRVLRRPCQGANCTGCACCGRAPHPPHPHRLQRLHAGQTYCKDLAGEHTITGNQASSSTVKSTVCADHALGSAGKGKAFKGAVFILSEQIRVSLLQGDINLWCRGYTSSIAGSQSDRRVGPGGLSKELSQSANVHSNT